ncbi:hypothetical protein EW145_g4516 [Phellinidium pouzarii]|uniref:Concentrative nucleoside transporter C-terminal domain-containing protein n=1 Tax=Phellinidium pouzarii TaxID=167371 RepID=A0A4S4L354_9AGAM|nr:hypothetical protein EW145_g4516 [Phellinidium pouzarii]
MSLGYPTEPALITDASPTRRLTRTGSSVDSTRKSEPADKEQQIFANELAKDQEEVEHDREHRHELYMRFRPYILGGLAVLILGWWISATILKATRHRWIVQTLFAWAFLLIILFRFIPTTVVSKPVSAVWIPFVQEPWYKLPYRLRLTVGWICLLGIVFGSAFGFKLTGNTNYGDRAISVLGLFIFQCCFYIASTNRREIPWPTVIVGLFLQQAIALFVLKSGAGFSIFKLGEIIFFIAFIQMMYYLGVMQWIIKNFAWFFFKIMNVSGAEAVVAAASPWIGQGESACLVRPYVDIMTESELHLTMTSGFSTISGSVLSAYIALGVPAQNLITSSVMSIPASIAISKIRLPELEEPITRGQIVIDRGSEEKNPPANALHAFSKGATFGLIVAGSILTNVLTILSLVATINGLLTWIGHGFGINHLTLQLVIGYIFYPVTFFLGVPRPEILRVSQLLATKLIANEFAAYTDLQGIMSSDNPLTDRAFTIASYSLCGFANLGSLGIQIGVLSSLAPSRGKIIARIALSAMVCGFISTLQTAGIATPSITADFWSSGGVNMLAGLLSFYFPLRNDVDYPSSQSRLATVDGEQYNPSAVAMFFTLQIFGGHIGIPIILLTLFKSKDVRSSTAGLSFVLNLWFSLCAMASNKSVVDQSRMRYYVPLTRSSSFFAAFTAVLGRDPSLVSRNRYAFYCTIHTQIVDIVPAIAALVILTVIIFEVLIVIKLYRMHKAFVQMRTNGGPPLQLVVRVGIFSTYSFLVIVACVSFWESSGDELPYVIQASLPTAAFLIFGTQRDLLEAWGVLRLWRWMRGQPTALCVRALEIPQSKAVLDSDIA